jgi:hypothetical protein
MYDPRHNEFSVWPTDEDQETAARLFLIPGTATQAEIDTMLEASAKESGTSMPKPFDKPIWLRSIEGQMKQHQYAVAATTARQARVKQAYEFLAQACAEAKPQE